MTCFVRRDKIPFVPFFGIHPEEIVVKVSTVKRYFLLQRCVFLQEKDLFIVRDLIAVHTLMNVSCGTLGNLSY